jgi:hypothetical protein
MAILGGPFSLGLRRNVIALYKFACRNYRNADDELFVFGFSRGAFTIRIVMGSVATLTNPIPTTTRSGSTSRPRLRRTARKNCSSSSTTPSSAFPGFMILFIATTAAQPC